MEIITIETPSLGDRSYVLVSGGVAAVDVNREPILLDTVAFYTDTHTLFTKF